MNAVVVILLTCAAGLIWCGIRLLVEGARERDLHR